MVGLTASATFLMCIWKLKKGPKVMLMGMTPYKGYRQLCWVFDVIWIGFCIVDTPHALLVLFLNRCRDCSGSYCNDFILMYKFII